MHLDKEDVNLFFNLWFSLIHSVNTKHKIILPYKKTVYGERMDIDKETFIKLRDKLWENPKWIDEFIKENEAHLSSEEKEILTLWRKRFIKGKFIVMKHLRKHSVLMSSGEETKLYGMIGISEPFAATLEHAPLPLYIETVLIPFKGRIISDSLLRPYSASFGRNYRESFNRSFNEAKETCGIIERLDGDIS